MRLVSARVAVLLGLCLTACGSSPPRPAPLAPGTFAFGVFGDGPYRSWEEGRFRRLVRDVNATDLRWFLHVGDILWYPCSDEALTRRRRALDGIQHAVVYTPGDNEWTDCHEDIAGRFTPLERLRYIRRTFFANPTRSRGARPMALESQSADPAWPEFVENARWRAGGFVFITIHVVGSGNATAAFPGRTRADDAEADRRMQAALAWVDAAFALARKESRKGVVVAMHGDPGFAAPPGGRGAFQPLLARLGDQARAFAGSVLLIHGDSHEFRVDHPLPSAPRLTRLETFGSPDIGWVRVVVDSTAGRIVRCEPRLMPRSLF